MSAGDVLLFSRPTTWANFRADKMGTVMCALIHLTTRSRWNHAALDIGDGMMVEAVSGGVRVTPIASLDSIETVEISEWTGDLLCNPKAEDGCYLGYYGNDREDVLAFATGRVGTRYGYLNAFWCGLRNVFPGLQVKQGNAVICSELVAEALERAGHDFGKDSALVSPADLGEHFGVARR